MLCEIQSYKKTFIRRRLTKARKLKTRWDMTDITDNPQTKDKMGHDRYNRKPAN